MTSTISGPVTTHRMELANYLAIETEKAILNNLLFGVFFCLEMRLFSTPTEPHFYVSIGPEVRALLIDEYHAKLQEAASLPSFTEGIYRDCCSSLSDAEARDRLEQCMRIDSVRSQTIGRYLETPAGIAMANSRMASKTYADIKKSVLPRIGQLLGLTKPLTSAAS